MNPETHLSRRERQIMDILHARGAASVAEVQAALPDAPGYSAVRALLRILEEKGQVKHRVEGAKYVYLARISRQAASRSALKRVVSTFFSGSISQAVAALLQDADARLPEHELERIERLIQQARKEGR
ncbi:MAG TPA: BlaI/MecI/CopY family transcriptional regulator [Verrucomicrobiae bacterium]|nr:BlaI/MecI/CopY family transcriptional regulator [Verrucomicrobiae bacterium]